MLPRLATIALTLGLAAAAAPPSAAQAPSTATQAPARAAPSGPPKLIVVISVDQFSADLFAEYRRHFTGGLARLSGGIVFPSGYQSHAATETCPGHSTILTGSRPARTGIIANNWFDLSIAREDKRVYCSEDPAAPGSSSRENEYRVSTHYLRVPTLGDRMKAANPRSRVAVASGKDRAAIMMGGRRVDQRWWWNDRDLFTNQDEHPATPSVTAVNAAVRQALAEARPALPLPPLCAARSRAVPVEGSEEPVSVGAGRFARPAGAAASSFRRSPEIDGATLALAMAERDEMRLGEGAATDLLIVGLSATDYVGHTYGTQGAEMCLNLLELDRSLGDFFGRLDATGVDYMVMLTADHGGLDVPERIRADGGIAARRTVEELSPDTMDLALRRDLHLSEKVLWGDGPFGDFYISRTLSARDRARVTAEAIRRYRASPLVEQVFTRAEIAAAPAPSGPPETWSLLTRAKASFDPERSGDFVVFLHPRVMPIFEPSRTYVATHGSPWDYDRRVPILFWRRGMTPFEQPMSVETADILPTLASFAGIAIPAGEIDGHCLDLIEGPETSCR